MKTIRAKANGDVITVSDETAAELIAAGIYDDATSTQVAPMTTESMPARGKKGK